MIPAILNRAGGLADPQPRAIFVQPRVGTPLAAQTIVPVPGPISIVVAFEQPAAALLQVARPAGLEVTPTFSGAGVALSGTIFITDGLASVLIDDAGDPLVDGTLSVPLGVSAQASVGTPAANTGIFARSIRDATDVALTDGLNSNLLDQLAA